MLIDGVAAPSVIVINSHLMYIIIGSDIHGKQWTAKNWTYCIKRQKNWRLLIGSRWSTNNKREHTCSVTASDQFLCQRLRKSLQVWGIANWTIDLSDENVQHFRFKSRSPHKRQCSTRIRRSRYRSSLERIPFRTNCIRRRTMHRIKPAATLHYQRRLLCWVRRTQAFTHLTYRHIQTKVMNIS